MKVSGDYQVFLDAIPDATVLVNENGWIEAVNLAWRRFTDLNGGDTTSYYVDHNYFAVCGTTASESGSLSLTVAHGLAGVLGSNNEFRCEYPCHSPSERRWFEVFISPLEISGVRHALVMHRNITARKLQQEEIELSDNLASELAALVATSTDAIISFDLDGNILTWNDAARELYGYTRDEVVGKSMEILYPPEWPVRIIEYRDKIIQGELRRFEAVRITKAGELKNISVSAAPVRSGQGEVVAISNFHRDITEQKQAEERQKFVTQELNHRTKNILSVVLAIERQTAKGAPSIKAFHESFSARLTSLLSSNELLVASGWRSVPLRALSHTQLEAFQEMNPDKIRIEGPPILLKPEAVQAIGMSFHELGTNSLKYGALGNPNGKLAIDWQQVEGKESRTLVLTWQEDGYLVEQLPTRRGFGHTVLTSLVQQSLGADVDYSFHASGVTWSASFSDKYFEPE